MKPQSAKAKGRNLQKLLVAKILEYFPDLKPDDVVSRSMGSGGEDIMLSPAARESLPLSFECKNKAAFAVYKDYEQAEANCKGFEPVLVIKANHKEPLVLVDLEFFLDIMKISGYNNVQ